MGCTSSTSYQHQDNLYPFVSLKTNLNPTTRLSAAPDGSTTSTAAAAVLYDAGTSDKANPLRVVGALYSYDLSYCYGSQKGFYPHEFRASNQDSYLVCEKLMQNSNVHVFGVFDGHGQHGAQCSHFAATNFVQHLARAVRTKAKSTGLSRSPCDVLDNGHNSGPPGSNPPHVHDIFTAAFNDLNQALHNTPHIDDSLSGTTGIVMVVKGDVLLVGNVGDSRAIIATNVDGENKFTPLSNDQTPYRKDERERLKKKGATVRSLGQLDGVEPLHENWGLGDEDESEDPPRVWDDTLRQPGCGFTRSIGDNVAELLGVCADPEVMTWKLTSNDRFAVLASDGVFEFVSSQAVVDLVSTIKNPAEAAKHVVTEAFRLWLTHDERADDITILIVMFDAYQPHVETVNLSKRSTYKVDDELRNGTCLRAKATLTSMKREEIRDRWGAGPPVMTPRGNWANDKYRSRQFNFKAHSTPKTPEEEKNISYSFSICYLFRFLTPTQKELFTAVMQKKHTTVGEVLIREGELEGNELYVVESGVYEVSKADAHGRSQAVFEYSTSGCVFGERSLIYDAPRSVSITCRAAGVLWVITKAAFRAVLTNNNDHLNAAELDAITLTLGR